MSYFLLPKVNHIINVNPTSSNEINTKQYVSNSLCKYYNETRNQIMRCLNANEEEYVEFTKIVNPYEFIYSKVPSFKFSVSKLKPVSNLFYELLEICINVNLFSEYGHLKINMLYFTRNTNDAIECFEMIRETYSDTIIYFNEITNENSMKIDATKFDFLFFEIPKEDYFSSLIRALMIIYKNQDRSGVCIIKIHEMYHKAVIDFLYILSSLYDKTYLLKPYACNVVSYDKYIICKKYNADENRMKIYKLNYFRLSIFLDKLTNLADQTNVSIQSLLDFNIPYYFFTKIDDISIILGHQQIEALDLIISILKHKNKEEKIENIKKVSIQKAILWCEKYKIPCNKFSEKPNIFLPVNNEGETEGIIDAGTPV